MLEEPSANTPRTAKKSRRSRSPRAIELRRLQNRIAQRNHRRKVQEMNQARKQSEDSAIPEERDQEAQYTSNTNKHQSRGHSPQRQSENASTDHQASQTDLSSSMTFYASSLGSECSNMIMAEDMMAHQAPSVPWMGVMAKPTQENENHLPQPAVSPQNCTCSAAAGPCVGHLEKMRIELLGEIMSPLQLQHDQQQQPHQNHHILETNNIARLQTRPLSPLSNYSRSSSSESGQRPVYSSNGTTQMDQLSQLPSYTPKSDTPSSKPPSGTHNGTRVPTLSAADNTRRFGALLETISSTGFHSLDEMVLEYYSARFEAGSLPAMAQCASRSRRIKAMMQGLQEDSRQWPRWESRGLHESVSQATISLCLGEMERLRKAHAPHQPPPSDPGGLIAALERLLQSSVSGSPTILDELKLSGKVDAAVDEMPHLWSLLTELAGSRGLYCDRIAKIVMVILLYTRCT